MYALMELSGQEYVDMYAGSMKDRMSRAKRILQREQAEAERPGRAVDELERELDAAEDSDGTRGADEQRAG